LRSPASCLSLFLFPPSLSFTRGANGDSLPRAPEQCRGFVPGRQGPHRQFQSRDQNKPYIQRASPASSPRIPRWDPGESTRSDSSKSLILNIPISALRGGGGSSIRRSENTLQKARDFISVFAVRLLPDRAARGPSRGIHVWNEGAFASAFAGDAAGLRRGLREKQKKKKRKKDPSAGRVDHPSPATFPPLSCPSIGFPRRPLHSYKSS
jgi:hypothetical protein